MQTFKEWLAENRKTLRSTRTRTRYDDLFEALAAVAEEFNGEWGNEGLQARLAPGYLVNMGQQFNFEITAPRPEQSPHREILFRAYLPFDGPVTLDFYDDEFTRCSDEREMYRAIVDFMNRPEIQGRLRVLSLVPARSGGANPGDS